MADHQHSLDLDKALAFAILMESDEGIVGKRPDYIMEKRRGLDGCRDRMEVRAFLDPFKLGIFDACRLKWFGEIPPDRYPETVTIPPEGACSSTTNEGEQHEVSSHTLPDGRVVTLRLIRCEQEGHPDYCYIQDSGEHVQRDICKCGIFPSPECLIDLHRHQSTGEFTGHTGLYA